MHLVINTHMSIFNINSLKWFISANIEIEFFTKWNILRFLRGSSEPNTEERVRGLSIIRVRMPGSHSFGTNGVKHHWSH